MAFLRICLRPPLGNVVWLYGIVRITVQKLDFRTLECY
jgi:hypothetical protein